MPDTREKRHTATSLLGWPFTPTVDPAVAGFPNSSRQAAAHVYSGIAAAGASGYRGLLAFWMGGVGGEAPAVILRAVTLTGRQDAHSATGMQPAHSETGRQSAATATGVQPAHDLKGRQSKPTGTGKV